MNGHANERLSYVNKMIENHDVMLHKNTGFMTNRSIDCNLI